MTGDLRRPEISPLGTAAMSTWWQLNSADAGWGHGQNERRFTLKVGRTETLKVAQKQNVSRSWQSPFYLFLISQLFVGL